ncbi:MAG: DNA-binding protein WhiA [Thermoanaerobacteraceae bacterium]|nr:DNA-binding protein WhiA [Thermoanaerobacteraceae bacterium]
MSFSMNVKEELVRIIPDKTCCIKAELSALLHCSGSIILLGNMNIGFHIKTENAAIARLLYVLFKKQYSIKPDIIVTKNHHLKKNNTYTINLGTDTKSILSDLGIINMDENGNANINYNIDKNIVRKNCCKKAYIRGAFMGCGSLTDPEKNYHMEFVTDNFNYAASLKQLLNHYRLSSKIIERKNNYVVYLKEGDKISDALNIMGAFQSLLSLENIRAFKEIRNNINRLVNCETANLDKTVNAAVRQIENINYIKENIGLESLPDSLREVAELRLKYENASLKELGEMLTPKMGKSGINHRLRKLDEIAESLRGGDTTLDRGI